jgi:hypothetical protein
MVHDKTIPKTLKNLLPDKVSSSTPYNLRNEDNRVHLKARSTAYLNSFVPKTTRDWNTLPRVLQTVPKLEEFARSFPKTEHKERYFYAGARRGQILHARIRLNCSALGEHLHQKGIKATPHCVCGAEVESAKHYLLECPNYEEPRNELFTGCEDTQTLTTEVMLFGSKELTLKQNEQLFIAVQVFIIKTKRFDT